jgi:CHAD domain-containing protein
MAKARETGLAGAVGPRRELFGAAALAGAAAVGGKLAWDKLSANHAGSKDGFRLRADEAVEAGIRRIAGEQLEGAHAGLRRAPKRKLSGAVHDARKRLKRVRATVRLARGALGEEVYRRENTLLRDAGRRLAGVRDAAVLIETLDGLEKVAKAELPAGATTGLRRRLEREREQALRGLRDDQAKLGAVLSDLESARARAAAWPLRSSGFDALGPGLRRTYRRGRKAMRRAETQLTSENLHEWRKRVKDLWHALQILRLAAPNRMPKLARRAHRLADLLGDDHDLAQLRQYAMTHLDLFDDRAPLVALMRAIDRRRTQLQRQAFKLGSRLYSRRPKRFVKAVERGFGKHAQPLAA